MVEAYLSAGLNLLLCNYRGVAPTPASGAADQAQQPAGWAGSVGAAWARRLLRRAALLLPGEGRLGIEGSSVER